MIQEYSGERLKRLRLRARLTQMQVVALAGVSEATICYLESGKRKPQTKTLDKILGIYAIRIQQLNNLERVLREGDDGGNISGQGPNR